MRLVCVVDDAVQHSSPFRREHGLAFLLEMNGKRLLFDTGQSAKVLLHNLELLEVDPATIDAVAISHAHYDHTGGLPALLDHLSPGTPLYANPDLFRPRYGSRKGKPESVGLSLTREELAARLWLRLDPRPQEILPGLWTTGEITERPETEGKSASHLMREGDRLVADAYKDDMALVLHLGDSLALLCGCCHAGLLNTLAHVRQTFRPPVAIIAGGLHLSSATAEDLERISEVLRALQALHRIYPNHCTGEKPIASLSRSLGPAVVFPCPAGTELDLELGP